MSKGLPVLSCRLNEEFVNIDDISSKFMVAIKEICFEPRGIAEKFDIPCMAIVLLKGKDVLGHIVTFEHLLKDPVKKREVFGPIIANGADGVFVVSYNPSGKLEPRPGDRECHLIFEKVLPLLHVVYHDYAIVTHTSEKFYSFEYSENLNRSGNPDRSEDIPEPIRFNKEPLLKRNGRNPL